MRTLLFTLIITLCSLSPVSAQQPSLEGAYLSTKDGTTALWLFKDQYCTYTQFSENNFVYTWGGPLQTDSQGIRVAVEFNSQDPDKVGSKQLFKSKMTGNKLTLNEQTYTRAAGKPQNLDGLWRITGRKEGENINSIKRGDRKTIKILVDGYFQWIAINPAQKGFYGTGGGNYSFRDNQYTEKLLFFSRDNSRVGATLSFHGEIKGNDWHHSGKSSKGDPIFEIWSRETE
ncbi:hypothetical protein ACR777_11425 [Sphingobacterium spiritivorum]|uniref:hypothetical protein n=1 Tax=Sphingobacterium spiritivorum TaxID=258 RepID=UPI003DA5D55B